MILCALLPSARNGYVLPVKLTPKVFNFTTDTPWLARKRLVRAMQRTQFRAKNAKNNLKPMDFCES